MTKQWKNSKVPNTVLFLDLKGAKIQAASGDNCLWIEAGLTDFLLSLPIFETKLSKYEHKLNYT